MLEVSQATEAPVVTDLDAFIEAHYRRLLGLATLKSGSREDAEDLAQEALIRLVDSWESVAVMGNPWGWLATVTVNLSISRWRRGTRAIRAFARLEDRSAACHEPERLVDLLSVVGDLPERQRTAVLLRHYAHLSTRETAEAMGCAEGTVKSLVHQARARLQSELEASDLEASDLEQGDGEEEIKK